MIVYSKWAERVKEEVQETEIDKIEPSFCLLGLITEKFHQKYEFEKNHKKEVQETKIDIVEPSLCLLGLLIERYNWEAGVFKDMRLI